MMHYFNKRLGAKLLLSYLAVILISFVVLLTMVIFTAPAAYNRHMMIPSAEGTSMPMMNPGMMGDGQGYGWQRGQSLLFSNFRAGIFDALFYAAVAAVLVAGAVSLFFSRRVIYPLRAMMSASQRISEGHYSERVTVKGSDEIAQLGERFNQMTERLEQTEFMRRRLIGDVSHELRTPLTAIKGYMEGLVDGVIPSTPETFNQIHDEADRLSRLVDDLQELSRVESGAFQLDIRPVSVTSLVDSTAKRHSRQFEEKNIRLTRSLPPDLPPVMADEDRLIQVLTNLLGNALMYTPSGGEVTVSVSAINGLVRFSVRDTGAGIPAESLPHIFDRFYRVDKSRSRQAGGGSGIGLTIARALVEAHGGQIHAQSAGEGQGSEFSFTIPVF